MTFEEWWTSGKYNRFYNGSKAIAEHVWDAATAAERRRCREIARNVGEEGILWFSGADKIADEIGE